MSSDPMETPPPPAATNSPQIAMLPSGSSSVNSRSSNSLRRRRRNEDEGGLLQVENDDIININNSDETPANNTTSRNRRRREQRQARQNRTRQQIPSGLTTRRTQSQTQHLPFIMPIWMAKKVYEMSNNNRILSNVNSGSPRNSTGNGYIAGAWRTFRNVLLGRGNHSSYESVDTTARQLSIYQYSPGSSPSSHRNHDDNLGQSTPPRDVENNIIIGEEPLSLPTLDGAGHQSSPTSNRSSEGLRRRTSPSSPTRRTRSGSTHSSSSSYISNSPNLSSPSSSSSSGGDRDPISPTTVSLTQRAIQLQMRQAQLHSRGRTSEVHNDSDNESQGSDALSNDESSSNDADDSSSTLSTGSDRNDTGCSQKNVYGVMRMSFSIGIFHLFVLFALHVTYIGPYAFRRPEVSPLVSARRKLQRSLMGHLEDSSHKLAFLRDLLEDGTQDAQKNTTSQALFNCISYALSTRAENERSQYYARFGDSDSERRRLLSSNYAADDDDDGIGYDDGVAAITSYQRLRNGRIMAQSGPDATVESKSDSNATVPIVGKDEIVQIKIMFGGKCTGQCSRVHHVDYSNTTNSSATSEKIRLLDQSLRKEGGNPFLRTTNNRRGVEEIGDDVYSSPEYWDEPHYRFSLDDALLYLDEKSALLHNITIVNVTVTERCLCTGMDDGKLSFLTAVGEFLAPIYGMDSVIINQFMYGIRGSSGSLQSGYLQNMETKERWAWTKEQLESHERNKSVADWILKKIGELVLMTDFSNCNLSFYLIFLFFRSIDYVATCILSNHYCNITHCESTHIVWSRVNVSPLLVLPFLGNEVSLDQGKSFQFRLGHR